jgi:RNA polymerase sigma-70 factor (ECF subfamily)
MHPDANASPREELGLEELMVAYQQADADAAAALVNRLSPQLHQFFAGPLGSRADAEDMLQDVWLRIHRVRHTYRPAAPLLPWVYSIAHRVRVDSYRKRRRTSREVGVGVLPEPANDGDRPQAELEFDTLLASLPESQREVLSMLKVDGLSIEEIALATVSTPGAVKQRAHRAYTRLRSVLQTTRIASA